MTKDLTDRTIKGLKPKDRLYDVPDGKVEGLLIRVHPSGKKNFCLRYFIGGRRKRFTLKPDYDALSLSDARNQAIELLARIGKGDDPQDEKAAKRRQITIAGLAERYKEWHLPELKASTQAEYTRQIDNVILPKLGKRPVKELARSEIVELLEDIAKTGPINSNRLKAVLSSMFSFAVDRAIIDHNPVKDIRPFTKERSRDRVLNEDEIKRLWGALEDEHPVIKGLFRILLLLGQRSGETKKMRWDQIDFDERLWTIPAEQTKNGQEHIVPLNATTLDILNELRGITGHSKYVFKSPSARGKGAVNWIQKSKKRIEETIEANSKREGSSGFLFRVHDLRRTAASYMARLGVDRTILGKTLNHKGLSGDSLVTAVYDRYSYLDEKRQALERWNAHLQRILTGDKEAKVYRM